MCARTGVDVRAAWKMRAMGFDVLLHRLESGGAAPADASTLDESLAPSVVEGDAGRADQYLRFSDGATEATESGRRGRRVCRTRWLDQDAFGRGTGVWSQAAGWLVQIRDSAAGGDPPHIASS